MHGVLQIATALITLSAPVAAQPAEASDVELRLLTFNILHGADAQGEINLEAKGRFLAEQAADLVFLQEIDRNCERSGRVDQMASLGEATGMRPVFGAFMPYQGGEYGMGTLAALPVLSAGSRRLPDGDEPRVALLLEVEVLGQSLLAVNVHFNWTEDDSSRFAQATALLEYLASIDLPTIVAGDFNDVPESRTMQAFYDAGFVHVEPGGPTWNATAPSVDIDHIVVRSGAGLQLQPRGGAVLTEITLSDHRPVAGIVRLAAPHDPGG